MRSADDDEVCGESFDHDLREIDHRDGLRNLECRLCGAEIFEEDEDDL